MVEDSQKIVQDTHIIGERGVIKFHEYCNKHSPYICFREITRNDFGIDGEVEIVQVREDGKKYITGQLIKVQLKSSFGEGGYINKRKDGSFSFYPKPADINYWSSYSLDVILIIYDDSTGNLYAKKIEKLDFEVSKNALKKKQSKIYSIDFNEDFKLEIGDNRFFQKFNQYFISRVNYNLSERLISNIIEVKLKLRRLFFYSSKYSNKKTLFEQYANSVETPFFVLYGKEIITLHSLGENYKNFRQEVLEEEVPNKQIDYTDILKSDIYKRYFIELLKEILKFHFGTKGIWYNRDYNRNLSNVLVYDLFFLQNRQLFL
jgi:hypothetical protein